MKWSGMMARNRHSRLFNNKCKSHSKLLIRGKKGWGCWNWLNNIALGPLDYFTLVCITFLLPTLLWVNLYICKCLSGLIKIINFITKSSMRQMLWKTLLLETNRKHSILLTKQAPNKKEFTYFFLQWQLFCNWEREKEISVL